MHAFDETCFHEEGQDLLQVFQGNVLPFGNFTHGDIARVPVFGEIHEYSERISSFRCDIHQRPSKPLSVLKQSRGEITVAAVRQKDDDGLSFVFRAFCQLDRGAERGA